MVSIIPGSKVGVKVVVLCGGMDILKEKKDLSQKPHIIVATPGRLVEHIKTTKNFSLDYIKFLVKYPCF